MRDNLDRVQLMAEIGEMITCRKRGRHDSSTKKFIERYVKDLVYSRCGHDVERNTNTRSSGMILERR